MVALDKDFLALHRQTLSVANNNMIERSRLSRMWKRIIIQLIAVDIFAVLILISLIVKRINTASGPTWSEIALILITLIMGSGIFFLVARSIKNIVERRSGVDEKS
jgi:uncharacterized integral membrane protein